MSAMTAGPSAISNELASRVDKLYNCQQRLIIASTMALIGEENISESELASLLLSSDASSDSSADSEHELRAETRTTEVNGLSRNKNGSTYWASPCQSFSTVEDLFLLGMDSGPPTWLVDWPCQEYGAEPDTENPYALGNGLPSPITQACQFHLRCQPNAGEQQAMSLPLLDFHYYIDEETGEFSHLTEGPLGRFNEQGQLELTQEGERHFGEVYNPFPRPETGAQWGFASQKGPQPWAQTNLEHSESDHEQSCQGDADQQDSCSRAGETTIFNSKLSLVEVAHDTSSCQRRRRNSEPNLRRRDHFDINLRCRSTPPGQDYGIVDSAEKALTARLRLLLRVCPYGAVGDGRPFKAKDNTTPYGERKEQSILGKIDMSAYPTLLSLVKASTPI